ncbi:MAG TPA: T9SS type A sorting domain-containing protein [Bacteroidia bacterium]|nr:T9SS type A sorting domain-containing protein [Bacteroidia bacterium]
MAASKLKQDLSGHYFRYLFGSDGQYLYRFIVDENGISYSQVDGNLGLFTWGYYTLIRSEMELFEKPDGSFVVAVPEPPGNFHPLGGAQIAILDANANWITEYRIDLLNQGVPSKPKGLEFSPGGEYLYFTTDRYPYVQYYDFTAATMNNLFLGAPDAHQEVEESFIELAYDGKLYFMASDRLESLSNPNNPNYNNWNGAALTDIYYPPDPTPYPIVMLYISGVGYMLPDQIDGEDYSNIFTPSTPACCTHFSPWNQNDFTANNVNPTWTASQNPLNGGTGSVAWVEGTLTIPSGVDITIRNMTINFGLDGKIIIEKGNGTLPGGKLTIEGTTLTGNTQCETMWKGVEVQGNPSIATAAQQGQFYMMDNSTGNHSIIEYAAIAVAAQTIPDPQVHNYINQGGHFELNDGEFYNNNISVYAIERGASISNFFSQINRCDFKGIPPYQWYPNAGNRPNIFASIYEYTGDYIRFGYTTSSNFNNRFEDGNYGIWQSETQNVDLTGCTFTNIRNGIYAVASAASNNSDLHISGCKFINTFNCINITGLTNFHIISNNNFNFNNGPRQQNYYGVLLRGGVGNYEILDNNFNNMMYAINILDDSPGGGKIFDNDFNNCWRGVDARNMQPNLAIKCNRFQNASNAVYSAAVGVWGCLADQLGVGVGAGNQFYNTTYPATNIPRLDIVSSPSSFICNGNPSINFIYNAYSNSVISPNQTPTVVTGQYATVDVLPAGNMQANFCLTPMEQLMDLADNDPDEAQELIANESDPVKQQLWVNELVQWYRDNNADGSAVNYLIARNDEPARKILLSLYISLNQLSNAQLLVDEYNNPNDDESYNYYLLNNVIIDWVESGRNAYGMTSAEQATLELVAESETGSAAQAKDILRFVFDAVFIESGYQDTTYFRIEYPGLHEQHLFSILPNPASDVSAVHYVIPDVKYSATLNLYDIAGRLLQNWTLSKEKAELFIDIGSYSNGVYMLEFSSGNNYVERQKFIIQKQK